MITKFKAVCAALVVFAIASNVVAANASTSRHELESQYHGNTRAR